jgi:hypothetical protein
MPEKRMEEPAGGTDSKTKAQKRYETSIYPGPGRPIPEDLAKSVLALEKSLAKQVWLLVQQDHQGALAHIDRRLTNAFWKAKDALPAGEPIALLVDSPGGDARAAYQLARFFRRRCGGFTAVVPGSAMSGATLLVLGADSILMGSDAWLGPLDAQRFDPDTETFGSVLDEVQALERLHAYALEAVDETMLLLAGRTGKRIESLLPHVLRFVADWSRPLLEKVDVVHYNEQARILKVSEEYAVRLLRPKHPPGPHGDEAERIARHLAEKYPEHRFPIDVQEVRELGLDVDEPTEEQAELLDGLWHQIDGRNIIGRVREVEVP